MLIQNHFQEVYMVEDVSNELNCLQVLPQLVHPYMNDKFNAPVTEQEIMAIVDGLGATKAPGPNVFNGMLHQRNWEIIKKEVCEAVMSFFTRGSLQQEVNETIVSLVPKFLMSGNINQLRPICCCNFIFNVISKLIVLRLNLSWGSW